AIRQLKKALDQNKDQFGAWLTFLGNELNRQPQTITVQNVVPRLGNHPKLTQDVHHIFQTGEAHTYGGVDHTPDSRIILDTAQRLHKVL
ncbi:MAG: hypothetical protein PF495_15870, partial [Spirochaetales bacterium]|nr:hypothetical protein [Spirochaetales bacterium]